jgi:hypothetical protein
MLTSSRLHLTTSVDQTSSGVASAVGRQRRSRRLLGARRRLRGGSRLQGRRNMAIQGLRLWPVLHEQTKRNELRLQRCVGEFFDQWRPRVPQAVLASRVDEVWNILTASKN